MYINSNIPSLHKYSKKSPHKGKGRKKAPNIAKFLFMIFQGGGGQLLLRPPAGAYASNTH